MRKLALFALLAFALAAHSARAATDVAVPHSGWYWGNPLPQGNTLHGLAFAGRAGYAAGDLGTLLKTTDGGLSWQALRSGVRANLRRVQALDASKLFIAGACVMRRSDDGGQTFARVPATSGERSCKSGVAAFHFLDGSTGLVVLSNGRVRRTGNGGHSFFDRGPIPGTSAAGAADPKTPADAWLLSSQTAIVISGDTIYRSTDGGTTWSAVRSAGQVLSGLYFASPSVGYAVGDVGTVLKTADGGVTWTPAAGATLADLTAIRCAPGNAQRCLMTTRSGEELVRTPNGGTTLSSVVAISGRKVFAAAFDTPGIAGAVGRAGATAVSANGGQNWTPVGGTLGAPLSRLRAGRSGEVFGTGPGGTLVRTDGAGADWTTLAAASSADLLDASFPTTTTGFALESDGDVQKTIDGGGSWSPMSGPAKARTVFAADARTVLLLGPDGLARSVDGGAFEPVGGEESQRPALTDYDRTSKGLVVYGPRALIVAGRSGRLLRFLQRPGGAGAKVRRADFLSSKLGFVLTTDGRLWATRNGGRKWSELRTTGTSRAYDMVWGDHRNGYLAVDRLAHERRSGYVLRTADGGHTWRPQLVAAVPIRRGGLVATAKRTLLALASRGQLLYTTTGGDRGGASKMTIASSRTRFARPRKVRIRGRIAPSVAGADAYVSVRPLHGTRWRTFLAKPASGGGRFSVTFKLSRSSVVVASWLGNASLRGDGSNVVAIRRRR